MKTTLIILAALLSGCSAMKTNYDVEGRRLKSLSYQHFKSTITVHDDPFEAVAVLDTERSFKINWGVLENVRTDAFIRGLINKSTGLKSYFVYVSINHNTGDWLFPYQANYGKPLRTTDTVDVHSKPAGCTANGCSYIEHIVFQVDNQEIDRIKGATPQQVESLLWAFKIKTKSGADINEGFNLKEWRALISAVESYRPIPR